MHNLKSYSITFNNHVQGFDWYYVYKSIHTDLWTYFKQNDCVCFGVWCHSQAASEESTRVHVWIFYMQNATVTRCFHSAIYIQSTSIHSQATLTQPTIKNKQTNKKRFQCKLYEKKKKPTHFHLLHKCWWWCVISFFCSQMNSQFWEGQNWSVSVCTYTSMFSSTGRTDTFAIFIARCIKKSKTQPLPCFTELQVFIDIYVH